MERQNLRVDILLASHVWEPLPTTRWGLSWAIFRSMPVWRMYVSPLYLPLYTSLAPTAPLKEVTPLWQKKNLSPFVILPQSTWAALSYARPCCVTVTYSPCPWKHVYCPKISSGVSMCTG